MTKVPDKLVQEIEKSTNIVLLTHTHPDGDALGSLLGLRSILESLGKNVFAYLEEEVSHLYDFLPDCNSTSTSLDEYRAFVTAHKDDILIIALDCGDDDRLGISKEEFLQVEPFLVIDHHRSHRNFGTSRWVDAERSSTGEMVYEVAVALGATISFDSAYCLYVAICTDTGSFKYESTSARTMHIVGDLLERGVKPDDVGNHLYDNYSRERLKLLELVLSTTDLMASEQVAFIHASRAMLEQSGATMKDVEGFIDFPRSLRSVKVAVFLKESDKNGVAVSLRAKGECDVAEVAKQFGGGGHRNAAGFRCPDKNIEQVRTEVGKRLAEILSRQGSAVL